VAPTLAGSRGSDDARQGSNRHRLSQRFTDKAAVRAKEPHLRGGFE